MTDDTALLLALLLFLAFYLIAMASRRPWRVDESEGEVVIATPSGQRLVAEMTPRTITVGALDADRLTAIIESRMSRDLAWLRDDGKTVERWDAEHVGWALAHLYLSGDVVSGLGPLKPIEAEAAPGLHRQADELGHVPGGAIFHLDVCARCGLMLAYLVRDQVECAHPTSGQ